MKNLNKLTSSLLFFVLALCAFSFNSYAVQPVTFDGPKITYDRKMLGLGDFAVFNFMGLDKVDAAVPAQVLSRIDGLDNLNQWPQIGPNVFYNINELSDGSHILRPLQVIEGHFNGNANSDLAILNTNSLTVCKDYTGVSCTNGFSALQMTDPSQRNWHAAVGKLKNGKDTIAVITQDSAGNSGHLLVYETDAAGEVQVPYYNQPVVKGTPYSLTIGDYNNDGKLDIAVATRFYDPSTGGEVGVYIYTNNGAGFDAPVLGTSLKLNQCYTPTGLLSYDPDGDSKSDLIVTCFDRLVTSCYSYAVGSACSVTYDTGYVYLFKNNGGHFDLQHTITNGIKFPYSSAVGKFNDDSLFDVAVANWQAKAVSVYAGNDTFKTEDLGKHYVTRFNPKYIQVADKNGDGLQDIIAVASSVSGLSSAYISGAAGASILDPSLLMSEAFAADDANSKDYMFVYTPDNQFYYAKPEEIINHYSYEPEVYPVSRETNKIVYDAAGFDKLKFDYKPFVYNDISNNNFTTYSPMKPDTKLKTNDAVIVLINYRPQVSFDPVDCSTTKVVAHCVAASGHTIDPAHCVFSSPDIPDAVANVQKVVNGNGVDLTFTLPQEERDYTATVVGTDDNGNSSTQTIVVKRQGCTPPAQSTTCPTAPVSAEVWVDDPFQVCAPLPGSTGSGVAASSSSAYGVTFTQTSGPNLFAPVGPSSALAAQTVEAGNCLSGRFKFTTEDVSASGTYKVTNNITGATLMECPWRVLSRGPKLEGESTGIKCSLSKDTQGNSFTGLLGTALLFVSFSLVMFSFKRSKAKE